MDVAEIGQFFADHYKDPGHTLFRLEVLPEYTVEDDGPNFRLWLSGATEPDPAFKEPWLNTLRRENDAGLKATRVRILGDQRGNLTDYERYACEFGYQLNAPAGEDIRVLRRGEHTIPVGIVHKDFWLVNGRDVIVMEYDEHGRFVEGVHLDRRRAAAFIDTHAALWIDGVGEPFLDWWGRHTELHRRLVA